MLAQIRNFYGALVLLVIGGSIGVVCWYLPATTVTFVAEVVTWLLLLAAPKPVLELARTSRRQRRGSDADQLARLTVLPAWVWRSAERRVGKECVSTCRSRWWP